MTNVRMRWWIPILAIVVLVGAIAVYERIVVAVDTPASSASADEGSGDLHLRCTPLQAATPDAGTAPGAPSALGDDGLSCTGHLPTSGAWYDIFLNGAFTLFGAFLGFVFGIAGEVWFANRARREQIGGVLYLIATEISQNKESLERFGTEADAAGAQDATARQHDTETRANLPESVSMHDVTLTMSAWSAAKSSDILPVELYVQLDTIYISIERLMIAQNNPLTAAYWNIPPDRLVRAKERITRYFEMESKEILPKLEDAHARVVAERLQLQTSSPLTRLWPFSLQRGSSGTSG